MELEQQFSLSWNNFHGNVSREFSSLLGSGELADVTLAVEGQLLQAHRVVLAICSPYFKRMFQANPCKHPIVVLRDVTHKAMRDLLQFMYHGEVSVKREDLTSFIGTAEVLQIKGLTNKETDEEEKEQELPKQAAPEHANTTTVQRRLSETVDSIFTEDLPPQSNHIDQKKREMIDKIQRLNNLKRKSEEFLQNNYNFPIDNDKRPKFREKPLLNPKQLERSYDNHSYNDDVPTDMTNYSVSKPNQDFNDTSKSDTTYDNSQIIDMKTECDDSDIVVTDPAVHENTKSYDSNSDQTPSKDTVPTSQDGALSLVIGDNQLPCRYKYIYSRKGHKQLVHMNFVYTKHSTSHGKTSWRCVQYFSLNRCPATVETVDATIYAINHQHNHDDCFEKIAMNNVYEMVAEAKQ